MPHLGLTLALSRANNTGAATQAPLVFYLNTATNTVTYTQNETTGTFDLNFTGSSAPWTGTYTVDLAELATRPVILATAPLTGTTTLTAIPALALVNNLTSRAYQWYRFGTATETIADAVAISGATSQSYTPTAGDGGYTVFRGETVTGDGGASAEAFTAGFEVVASEIASDTFTDTDGTLLTAHTSDSGHAWQLLSGGSTTPVISGNVLDPDTSSGGSEYYGMIGPSVTDVAVSADIDTGSFGAGLGVLARVTGTGGTFNAYYARAEKDGGRVRLYRIVNGSASEIGSQSRTISGTETLVLRCDGDTISVDWAGVTEISVTDTAVAGAGSVGVGHFRGNTMKWDNLLAEAV